MSGKLPLTVFRETITRSKRLLDLVDQTAYDAHNDDIIRGATILAVAAYDRYFTAKFCDILVPHLKSSTVISKDLIKRLESAGLDTSFSLELIVSKRPFRKIRTIVQASLSRVTTHRSSVINDIFVSVGLKDLTKNAQKRAGRKNLEKRIQKLVDMRNEIAHEAHINAHGNAKTITSADIRLRIEDVELFVEHCDAIIDSRFGKKPPVSA